MDFATAQPFLNNNALVAQYANQAGAFQPTPVSQPNAANLRLRDVLMSQGTASPYVGASTGAGTAGAEAAIAGQSPIAVRNAGRTVGNMQQNLQDRALTSMFPVVSQLALSGAQQELGRYTGTKGLQQTADQLRLKGILGAGEIASKAANIGSEAIGVDASRMANAVATPLEALQAEYAKAQGLQNIGETQYGNTWYPGGVAPRGGMDQFTAAQRLQAGRENLGNLTTQLNAYGGGGYVNMPGLRNYYG